jgi:hypothetical protein
MEIFLWGKIKSNESFCVWNCNEIILSLEKNDIDIEWPTLEKKNLNKKLISELRLQESANLQFISNLSTKIKLGKYKHFLNINIIGITSYVFYARISFLLLPRQLCYYFPFKVHVY